MSSLSREPGPVHPPCGPARAAGTMPPSMDRIWAPWRGEYIKSIPQMTGCFLCEAAKGPDDRAGLVVARRKEVFVVVNKYPFVNGHLMVAPYAHGGDPAGLPDAVAAEMMTTARDLCGIFRETMRAEGFNMGLNAGRAGGAGLPDHLHLHVIPRWPGDSNFMPVLADTRVISQSLDALWEFLSVRLADRWQ